ncbi:MAG TPA: hypothetical protein DGD08_14510 [Gemmatimonas aurantiaca]|uniref:Uncharacterized protein n=2 Tax=Gemmatimonas aurantiaca TaxID=173480 RepID=C1A9X9_GEMAT|nr:hypothetical protein [Gemmatimonas aurantiaca]BAH39577.1 hypothetical protein GAU_2535 [Gemmatimonas aurantiaca T-27]HCT58413.1 hypothetical protein [Gemmatimonas aurantiaca]
MSEHARQYLIDRFREDAHALRERVATMRRGVQVPGPDVTTSERMAEACDDVATVVSGVAAQDDATTIDQWVATLVTMLEDRQRGQTLHPAVRAVYAGGVARVREVAQAERRDESR